jgi:hypothetical protein
MSNAMTGAAPAPRAFIRTALLILDLGVAPVAAFVFGSLLAFAAAVPVAAAGGVVIALGIKLIDVFPVWPAGARILTGASVVAFAAVLGAAVVLAWTYVRPAWQRFAGWHAAAWRGEWTRLAEVKVRAANRAPVLRWISGTGLAFLALFALAFALMMLLARGPFWHAWGWFV